MCIRKDNNRANPNHVNQLHFKSFFNCSVQYRTKVCQIRTSRWFLVRFGFPALMPPANLEYPAIALDTELTVDYAL